jgi:hypothetical protein
VPALLDVVVVDRTVTSAAAEAEQKVAALREDMQEFLLYGIPKQDLEDVMTLVFKNADTDGSGTLDKQACTALSSSRCHCLQYAILFSKCHCGCTAGAECRCHMVSEWCAGSLSAAGLTFCFCACSHVLLSSSHSPSQRTPVRVCSPVTLSPVHRSSRCACKRQS